MYQYRIRPEFQTHAVAHFLDKANAAPVDPCYITPRGHHVPPFLNNLRNTAISARGIV